ncbi:Pol protein, partial [Phytophthora palmivora]
PQAAEAAGEGAEGASGVGNTVPHEVEETEKIESAVCVSSVGNRVPRGVKKTSTSAEVSLSTSRVDNQVPHSESETPPARPVEEQCHVFDGVSGRQVRAGAVHLEALPEVSALLNLEELSMKDFLAEFKAREITEMVLLKPETSPEDLNSSSVIDKDVLERFTKQRATRLYSEILRFTKQRATRLGSEIFNPEDPVYPLVNEFSDVVLKHPPSNSRRIGEYGTRLTSCLAKSGMVQESKSPHSTPTFCVRKPNGKWRPIHACNKLNNATVPAQTPIPRKDVLLNNMSGCTLEHPEQDDLAVASDATRAIECPSDTYIDDIFGHSRAEDDQAAMEVHLQHLRRVSEVMRANKLYVNIDKCVFAAEEINVLGCFVSRVGVRADPGKVKAIAAWPTLRSQKDIRKWLGLANYIHKYSAGVLLQKDDEGHERVISFQSRQLKAAERNYPVHDKELLAMKWLSFFVEYNFRVEYKPGKLNVLADALSR